MKRWALIDISNNKYEIDNKSFKLLTDDFIVEAETIERSYQPGADFPGLQRDASKELSFVHDLNISSENTFREEVNNITRQFRKTLIIRDQIRDIQTEVLYIGQSIEYDEGGFNKGAKITVNFKQIIPFWEDVDENEVVETGTNIGVITINNSGYIETPPEITIEAEEQITKFSVRINETGDGILIRDLQFGINGLNTYIIDNKEGISELNQINRNNKIARDTGFFNLKVGINTIIFESNGSASLTISWKRRYYI